MLWKLAKANGISLAEVLAKNPQIKDVNKIKAEIKTAVKSSIIHSQAIDAKSTIMYVIGSIFNKKYQIKI